MDARVVIGLREKIIIIYKFENFMNFLPLKKICDHPKFF